MDGVLTIILRIVFLYFFLLIVFRVMGKREIGQLSVLDFVILIMIGELAVLTIEDPKTPMMRTIISIGVLAAAQVLFSFLSLKNEKIRHYMDGRPTTIIDKGKLDENEMRRQRYNFDDLLVQLRENNVKNLSDVEFAILEPTGDLSVYKNDDNQNEGQSPSPDQDLDIPLPLILDGKVEEKHLERIHQTPLWLRQQLRNLGYKDIKNISYCEMKPDGTFYIDLKDEI
ncbi:MAG TPA: DUF421 domain-containing protein [Bacillales bacterium]|nr:DUF421 domain-containing protein [Bacillales bacterium]